MAQMPNAGYRCGPDSPDRFRKTVEGFDIETRVWVRSCRPLSQASLRFHVADDGTVTELERSIVHYEPEGCVVP